MQNQQQAQNSEISGSETEEIDLRKLKTLKICTFTRLKLLIGEANQIINSDDILEAEEGGEAELSVTDVKIECATDGRWLNVGGRLLTGLRNKQCSFVITMVEAWHKGNRRPRLDWALRQAGYREGTYALKHISTRPEFFEFFRQENGECIIIT